MEGGKGSVNLRNIKRCSNYQNEIIYFKHICLRLLHSKIMGHVSLFLPSSVLIYNI